MNKIDFNDKLFNILDGNDKLLDFFINNGFDQLKDKEMLKTMGKLVTLNMALKVKGINKEAFSEKLFLFLNNYQKSVDKSLEEEKEIHGDVIVKGVLPCPIKTPLLDAFDDFVVQQKDKGLDIGYDLKSANLGLDWIEEDFKNNDIDDLADVFISAGFELFFDKDYIGKYIEDGKYSINIEKINKDFDNEKYSFKDPKNRYHIISVVPCVFLINKNNLSGRKAPKSWKELLFSGNYTDSVSLPLNDLDMFNAILVNIYSKWGKDGIRALGKIYKKSLHPAEMVRSKGDSKHNPAVNIIPLFFTQMALNSPDFEMVWPSDGALVSPIFLVAKKDNPYVEKIIEFFTNLETGKILSLDGKFPTTIYGVDNNLGENEEFLFCGWDFIYDNNIIDILKESEKIFNEEILS
ncbi:MAG: ABC transporter substrate-binding protein [Peptoniphilaceae bacterium]